VARLAVIGNISFDHDVYPGGQLRTAVGGAALHIALAATAAGLHAAPIAVIGDDMRWLPEDPSLARLDWSGVGIADGKSAAFTLIYDTTGDLTSLQAEHGAASGLTRHAVQRIEACCDDAYHVCCRTPLDIGHVLGALAHRNAVFSADFMVSSVIAAIPAAARNLPRAQVVFANSAEHQALAEAVTVEDLPAVVVSDGPRTARLYRHGQLAASANPPQVAAARVTGAGDTLAGAFLAALSAGLPDAEALRLAVSAASAHTTSPSVPVR
jgi:sugar/nucleoside kinase (ribokinase family)